MVDVFEGAKFGDKFLTRNGKVARYCGKQNVMFVLAIDGVCYDYFYDGTFLTSGEFELDIVKRCVDENLDHLANKYAVIVHVKGFGEKSMSENIAEAYKAGFNKANEL